MLTIALNTITLQYLAEFIALYLGQRPELDEIQTYIELKLHEKDIPNSYSSGLITKDEVCSFITAHLFTKFVHGQGEVVEVDDIKIDVFNKKLKELLFEL